MIVVLILTFPYEDKRARVTYDSTKETPLLIAKAITEGSGFKANLSYEP